jgi:hypothetical protein
MNRGPGNPLALGLVIVGAAALAVAAFLPLDEPTGVFRMVEHNTLIQHGGWTLIALAIGIAASGFQASQRRGNWLAVPIVLCVLAGLEIFNLATDDDSRTLYPVKPDGTVDTSKPGTVAPKLAPTAPVSPCRCPWCRPRGPDSASVSGQLVGPRPRLPAAVRSATPRTAPLMWHAARRTHRAH